MGHPEYDPAQKAMSTFVQSLFLKPNTDRTHFPIGHPCCECLIGTLGTGRLDNTNGLASPTCDYKQCELNKEWRRFQQLWENGQALAEQIVEAMEHKVPWQCCTEFGNRLHFTCPTNQPAARVCTACRGKKSKYCYPVTREHKTIVPEDQWDFLRPIDVQWHNAWYGQSRFFEVSTNRSFRLRQNALDRYDLDKSQEFIRKAVEPSIASRPSMQVPIRSLPGSPSQSGSPNRGKGKEKANPNLQRQVTDPRLSGAGTSPGTGRSRPARGASPSRGAVSDQALGVPSGNRLPPPPEYELRRRDGDAVFPGLGIRHRDAAPEPGAATQKRGKDNSSSENSPRAPPKKTPRH